MRLYLLLLLISLFFLSSALDVYESLSTTSQYINAADDGTSNIIVTYYDTTLQKTVIKNILFLMELVPILKLSIFFILIIANFTI